MNSSPKSTSEIRMIAAEAVRARAETCDALRKNIEDKIDALASQRLNKAVVDLRVALGEAKTQIRITWVLLMLVIGGLVGVAFSVWRAAP